MLWFLWACSDYNLHSKGESLQGPEMEEEIPPQSDPLLVVDPLSLSVSGLCTDEVYSTNLQILNAGEGDLVISEMDLQAPGWSLSEQPFPLVIPSHQIHVVELQATEGAGVLNIVSNDPTAPSFWVTLEAQLDVPPILEIQNPVEGTIVPVHGTEFVAAVADVEDDLTQLSVSWYSDVDGFLASTAVDAQGKSILEQVLPSPGAQEVYVTVQDSCNNEGYDAIAVCQQFGYETENLDISTWNFEGSASWDSGGGFVQLTPASTDTAGTAFSTASVVNAENVEIEFLFYASGGSGADGFSLTALDVDRMSGFVGETGGGIGYAGLPGWSIEVDTYYNGSDPTSQDHVAFSFDGNVHSPVAWAVLPDMEDGQWHSMLVSVHAPHILVEIDGVVYLDQNITGNLNFPAYVGFTAATGSLTNQHLIDALVVTEEVCSE